MKPIAIVNTDYDDYLNIDFMVSNICNYSCKYCYLGSNEGDMKFPNKLDTLIDSVIHMLNIYQKDIGKKEIKFEITGGEPTLWPELDKFSSAIKEYNNAINIAITTNGSQPINWWRENSKSFDEIHLSLHSLEGNVTNMIEVADYLYNETDCHVAVNVVMNPDNWERSMLNLKSMVEHPTPWLVKSWLLFSSTERHIMSSYTKEQLQFMSQKVHKKPPEERIQQLIAKKLIPMKSKARVVYSDGTIEGYDSLELRLKKLYNFFGWRCSLGVDKIRISGDGLISGSCGARNLFNLKEPLSMYDIDFQKKFTKDIIKPIICNQFNCGGCTSDIKLPKAKIFDRDDVHV